MTSAQAFGVLFGIFVTAMAVVTVIRGAKEIVWLDEIRSVPARLLGAWDSISRPLGLASLLIVVGLPSWFLVDRFIAPIRSPNIVEIGLVLLVMAIFIGGLILFVLAVIGFFIALFSGGGSAPGLDAVLSQRVHDTGRLARDAAIDAALRDEDEGNADVLEFDE